MLEKIRLMLEKITDPVGNLQMTATVQCGQIFVSRRVLLAFRTFPYHCSDQPEQWPSQKSEPRIYGLALLGVNNKSMVKALSSLNPQHLGRTFQ